MHRIYRGEKKVPLFIGHRSVHLHVTTVHHGEGGTSYRVSPLGGNFSPDSLHRQKCIRISTHRSLKNFIPVESFQLIGDKNIVDCHIEVSLVI